MAKESSIEKALRLHKADKLNKASEIYRRLLKKNRKDVDALHYFGVLQDQQGNSKKGRDLIQRAIELNPSYSDAHNNLGNVVLKLGDYLQARRCYETVLRLDPNRIETHNNLGVLLRHLGDLDASYDHLDKALDSKPDWAEAYYNMGNTLSGLGNKQQALDAYLRAISLAPKFTLALKRAGGLLFEFNRVDEAISLYKKCLAAEPDNPDALHMLAAISGKNVPERSSDAYIIATFDDFATSFDSRLEQLQYQAPQLVCDHFIQWSKNDARFQSNSVAPKVLDAGCGTGLCGPIVKPFTSHLIGVDLSSLMLVQAKEKDCYDDLICQELTAHLNRYNASIDAVISADVLNYFGQLDLVFERVHNALTTGGLFVFTLEKSTHQELRYHLQPHGRYAHQRDYIESGLTEMQFESINISERVIRKELGEDVIGWLVAAKK